MLNKSFRPKSKYIYSEAIRKGQLVRKPCVVCGKIKVDGHHSDYAKPLDVVWVCRLHHKRLFHLKPKLPRKRPLYLKICSKCGRNTWGGHISYDAIITCYICHPELRHKYQIPRYALEMMDNGQVFEDGAGVIQ